MKLEKYIVRHRTHQQAQAIVNTMVEDSGGRTERQGTKTRVFNGNTRMEFRTVADPAYVAQPVGIPKK